jgi:hypothetical protein
VQFFIILFAYYDYIDGNFIFNSIVTPLIAVAAIVPHYKFYRAAKGNGFDV